MTSPLSGIRVLDLTRVLSGPHCTRMLADLGADVIKVEPPDADMTRFAAPRVAGMSSYYVQQNAGKRNVSVDLGTSEGIDLVRRMVQHCDVLVENFRAGVADRLGVGPQVMMEINPRLVYCSISGYGATGPWTQRRAYAPSVGAETGLTRKQAEAGGGRYANDPHNHADVYTALEACTAILAALLHRGLTGEGQFVDVSMAETMMYVNEHAHDALWDRPVDPAWVRSFGTGDFPVVRVASGEWVVVCANPIDRGTFERLMGLIDRSDLAADPDLSSVSKRRERIGVLHGAIEQYARSIPDAGALEAAAASVGLAVGVVRAMDELAATEWAHQRRAVVGIDDRVGGVLRLPNAPWRFSRAPDVGVRGAARYRGEDNTTVLVELLGLTADEVTELETHGVIGARVPQPLTEHSLRQTVDGPRSV